MRKIRLIAILLALCPILAPLFAESKYVDPSTKANYHDVTVEEYILNLNVDPYAYFKQKENGAGYRGTILYLAHILQSTQTIVLDAVGLKLANAKFISVKNKRNSLFEKFKFPKSPVPLTMAQTEDAITLTFPKMLNKDEWVSFQLDVTSAKHDAGLLFVPPTATAGKLPAAFTQLEDIDARKVFPCQDTPQVHSAFKTTLNVPAGMKGFASGNLKSTKGKTTFIYETDFIAPVYLYAITVGNYESEKVSKNVEVIFESAVKEQAISFAKNSQDVIDYYEKYLNFPYPLKNLRVAFIPGFPWGGMENMGFIFLQERFLVPDNVKLPSGIDVLPHEIVHHWYGNTVTMADRRHIWVNEGPTSYLDQEYIEDKVSPEGAQENWQDARISSMAYEFNRKRDVKFSALRVNYDSLEDFFNAPNSSDKAYNKGPWLFNELRAWIGKEGVKTVLRAILPDKNEKKKLLTVDQFAEELLSTVANQAREGKLNWPSYAAKYFEALIKMPGHPELDVACKVNPKGDIVSAVITQPKEQTWKDGSIKHGFVYPVGKIDMKVQNRVGSNMLETPELVERTVALKLPDGTTSFFLDPKGKRYIEVRYTNCFNFKKANFVKTEGDDYRILAEYATNPAFIAMIKKQIQKTSQETGKTFVEVATTYSPKIAAALIASDVVENNGDLTKLVLEQSNVPLRLRTAEALWGILTPAILKKNPQYKTIFRKALAQEKAYSIAAYWFPLVLLGHDGSADATLQQELEAFLSRFLPKPGWQSLFANLTQLVDRNKAGATLGLEAILRQGTKKDVPIPSAQTNMLTELKKADANSKLNEALKNTFEMLSPKEEAIKTTYVDWYFSKKG